MTPDPFTLYATGLQTALAAALPAYAFSIGQPPDSFSVPPSAAVGYVWVAGVTTDPANQLMEHMEGHVRLYPVQAEQFDGQTPIDPSVALYPDANALQAAIQGIQVPSGGDPWSVTIQQVAFDHQNQFAEATADGLRWNDGTSGMV